MSARSIVTIDVNDDQFQEFMSRFREYQEALEGLPEEWRGVGVAIGTTTEQAGNAADETERMAAQFRESLESINALRESIDGLNGNLSRTTKTQDDLNKKAQQGSGFMKKARDDAKGLASSLKDATISLLSWGGILGLVGGVGVGFGLGALATGAAQNGATASGNNSTVGSFNAAGVNFGGVLDSAGATLSKISSAQQDMQEYWKFNALGVRDFQRDAGDLLPDLLRGARQKAIAADGNMTQLEGTGVTRFFSREELNRLRNMSDSQFEMSLKRYTEDQKNLQLTNQVNQAWQDLLNTMQRSNISMKNTFIELLTPLAPKLGQLSTGLTHAAGAFLHAPIIADLIDRAATGLESAADYLSSPEFSRDVDTFLEGLKKLGSMIVTVYGWIFGSDDKTSAANAEDHTVVGGVDFSVPKEEFRTRDGRKPFWMKDQDTTPAQPDYAPPAGGAIVPKGSVFEGIPQPAKIDKKGDTVPDHLGGYVPLIRNGVHPEYDDIIDKNARLQNVDANFLKSIIGAESSWNPNATSSAGAMGLAQVMPVNVRAGENPYDPEDNIRIGARVLRDGYNYSRNKGDGSLEEAARYYNGGTRRGSKENREYAGRVRDSYNDIFGDGRQRAKAYASTTTAAPRANRESNRADREMVSLLREIRDAIRSGNGVTVVSRSAPGENAVMESKLIGGYG